MENESTGVCAASLDKSWAQLTGSALMQGYTCQKSVSSALVSPLGLVVSGSGMGSKLGAGALVICAL